MRGFIPGPCWAAFLGSTLWKSRELTSLSSCDGGPRKGSWERSQVMWEAAPQGPTCSHELEASTRKDGLCAPLPSYPPLQPYPYCKVDHQGRVRIADRRLIKALHSSAQRLKDALLGRRAGSAGGQCQSFLKRK